MKNHLKKGEIATLLTLGLVIVGAAVTIATSLIANNQKNIASNPRATTTYSCCKVYGADLYDCKGTGKSKVSFIGTYSSECSKNLGSVECSTIPGAPTSGFKCIDMSGGAAGGNDDDDLANCPFKTQDAAKKGCDSKGVTSAGCKPNTFKCVGSPVSGTEPDTDDDASGGYGSGGNWPSTGEGFNLSLCPNTELPFACCVKDGFACSDGGSGTRFRWYGCTGQPCPNTKISQSSGPGTLVKCEYGAGPSKPEVCSVPPAGQSGTDNGKCLSRVKSYSPFAVEYYCTGNLICSEQSSKGVCVENTSANRCQNAISCSNNDNVKYYSNNSKTYRSSADCQADRNATAINDICGVVTPAKCETIKCPDGTTGGPYYKKVISTGVSPGVYYFNSPETCDDAPIGGDYMGVTTESKIQEIACKGEGTEPEKPDFINEGTCNALGTAISFNNGNCRYFEVTGSVQCSGSTPIYNENGCTIYRVCGGNNCRYDCYHGSTKTNCLGVGDPQTGYDYIRIVNTSDREIEIGQIVLEKIQLGGHPNRSLGGVTLAPGESKVINLNTDVGGTYACSAVSFNSVKVYLFNPDDSLLTSASDGCGGGVKILINLK